MLAKEKILKLLLERPRFEWKQVELAKKACCSKAFVSKLIKRWSEQGLVARPKPRSVLLISFTKALNRWLAIRQLPEPVYVQTRLSKAKAERLIKNKQGYALTLFSAAWLRTKFMKTECLEIYVLKSKLKHFIKLLGKRSREPTRVILFPVEKDFLINLERIEGFWCVSAVQNYVDLISLGGTGARVAKELARKYFE